jgi:transcriptional regulator with XRE-family HTH domain
MPTTIARRSQPASPRPDRQPPHLPLKALRKALGLTLEDVSERITVAFPEMEVSRGTLSAIESGSRGVSDLMLQALERAYNLPAGSLTTAYTPRQRDRAEDDA